MFTLFHLIILIIVIILDSLMGLTFGAGNEKLGYGYVFYNLAVFVPALAVLARRLHDVGKSGWFAVIALIPLIGAIWLLVLICRDSNPGENKYGFNPKEGDFSEEPKAY